MQASHFTSHKALVQLLTAEVRSLEEGCTSTQPREEKGRVGENSAEIRKENEEETSKLVIPM